MRVSPFLVRQLGKVSNTRAISQIFRGEWYLPCPPALAREAEGQLYVLDAPLLCSPGHLPAASVADTGAKLNFPPLCISPASSVTKTWQMEILISCDKGKKTHREETLRDALTSFMILCRRCQHRSPCYKPYRSRFRSLPTCMEATRLMWLFKLKLKHQSIIKNLMF